MDEIAAVVQNTLRSVSLEMICATLIFLLIALVITRLLLKIADRLLVRSSLDERMRKIAFRALKIALYLVLAIVVVTNLGIDISSLVALLSVLSLGVTLAAEDVLANMAGGLVIFASHPFTTGDYIEVSGAAGTVEEVTLNYTKLITPDGQLVMLPNKTIADSQMTNYTVSGRRRVTQVVGASYDAPTEVVKTACLRAAADTEHVLTDPPPMVFLSAYKDSCIEYTVYCWTEPAHFLEVRGGVAERLRGTFAQAKIEMTYPHLNVHLQKD